MSSLYAGITVARAEADVVLLSVDGDTAGLEAVTTFRLQNEDRPTAYHVLFEQLGDFLKNKGVATACIQGSAVNLRGTTMAHLESAELRGVVGAAAASAGCKVHIISPAVASRQFGNRKRDEYLADDQFWLEKGLCDLKKGKRGAAFVALFHIARASGIK